MNVHIPTDETQWREHVPEFFSRNESSDARKQGQWPRVHESVSEVRRNSLYLLNRRMDGLRIPYDVNEATIRLILAEADRFQGQGSPVYWLTVARIAELALIVAGEYADGCEFQAAGDLLVNPGKIYIHLKGGREPVAKNRHQKLSEQLGSLVPPEGNFIEWFRGNVSLEMAEKALIPELCDRVEKAPMIHSDFANRLRRRAEKVAAAIGFLSAWQIEDAGQLHEKLRKASDRTRDWVKSNLCGFDQGLFYGIGRDIRKLAKGFGCPGDILSATVAGPVSGVG